MPLGEQLFVAWGGLRGAAPIILAAFPLLAGWHRASTVFNLVFFLVLVSVLVQGTSLPWVARWPGVLVLFMEKASSLPLALNQGWMK